MSQSALAKAADVSRDTLRRYTRGLPITRKSRAAIEAALAKIAPKTP